MFVLILLWFIRDYLIYLLLPNLFILIFLRLFKLSGLKVYLIATAILLLPVIAICITNPAFTAQLKTEQSYFFLVPPDPDYNFRKLDGTMADVVQNIPYVINNILFRPNLLHSTNLYRIYQSAELILTWLFILFCLTRYRKNQLAPNARLFILFFCLEALFIYGLMVTDADSLSRYRSILLFFLIILAFLSTKPLTLYKNKYLKDSGR